MSSLHLILLTLVVLPMWTITTLYRNYQIALQSNLPVVISPVNPFNPIWILLRPYINPVLAHLPFNLGRFTLYNYLGWAWRDKNRLHTIHGPAFMIVTPAENQLIVGDAAACDDIFKHWRDFPKNPAFNDSLNIFGHNVGTAEGNSWQRQRKITTAAFNERNSSLVWREAVKQAKQMLSIWASGPDGITSTTDDTNLFALHVLTGAGFGLSYDFDSTLKKPADGHSMSYRDALRTIMGNIFITFAIASAKVPIFLLPQKVRLVLEAIKEFKCYMAEMVGRERMAYARGEGAQNANLMSAVIRASEDAGREVDKAGQTRGSLTDEEIWGNLFIYNIAGHETTAGTLAYAIALLACYPQWQYWLQQELDQVFGDGEVDENQYQQAFPQLKRCLATMYETLRLYAPLNGIPRYTGASHQQLRIGSTPYTIPPHTAIFINNAALQSAEQHWGPDALLWRPDRWIQPDPTSPAAETFFQPPEHVYIPWAAGPRVCPGRKFSQVEFVAAVACLVHTHRVLPVVLGGETEQQARHGLMDVLADSDMALAMRINHPERLKVRWERRRAVERR